MVIIEKGNECSHVGCGKRAVGYYATGSWGLHLCKEHSKGYETCLVRKFKSKKKKAKTLREYTKRIGNNCSEVLSNMMGD